MDPTPANREPDIFKSRPCDVWARRGDVEKREYDPERTLKLLEDEQYFSQFGASAALISELLERALFKESPVIAMAELLSMMSSNVASDPLSDVGCSATFIKHGAVGALQMGLQMSSKLAVACADSDFFNKALPLINDSRGESHAASAAKRALDAPPSNDQLIERTSKSSRWGLKAGEQ